MVTWIEATEVLRNLSLIIASAVGSYVAIVGLSAWRQERIYDRKLTIAGDTIGTLHRALSIVQHAARTWSARLLDDPAQLPNAVKTLDEQKKKFFMTIVGFESCFGENRAKEAILILDGVVDVMFEIAGASQRNNEDGIDIEDPLRELMDRLFSLERVLQGEIE